MNKLDPNNIPEGEVPKNLEDYICRICSFILNDPFECENCGTPYCRDCLEAWHQRSSQCPIKCSGTLKIKPAHRFIKKMLGELKIKCPTNECNQIISCCRLDYHLSKDCEFLLVKCSNTDCEEYIMRKDANNHLEVCKYKEITCKKCNEKIKLLYGVEYNNSNKQNMMVDEQVYSHDCITILSDKVKILNTNYEKVFKKSEVYEKDIQELKDRTNLLMSNIAYKCDLAHPLIFKATWTSTCSCCGLIKICTRWECTTCKKNYCLDCIRLLNSVFCPNFHTFLYGDRGNFLCDICGAKKTQGGNLSLHDPVCDFDLCDNCVMKLFPNLR